MSFAYHRPDSVEAAVELAAAGGRILAGGQSLMPLVKRGEAEVRALVDINRLPGLDTVTIEDGFVRIGALARLETLRTHPLIIRFLPLLAAALAWVANPAVRMRGTLVGNLAHNGPGAEAVAAAALAEARLVTLAPSGRQATQIGEVAANGLVVEVALRACRDRTRGGFYEVQRRFGHLGILGCGVTLSSAGEVRTVLCGLVDAPLLAPTLGRVLADGPRDDAAISAAIEVDLAGRPIRSDLHVSADYRRDVAPAVVRRAVAAARAGRPA